MNAFLTVIHAVIPVLIFISLGYYLKRITFFEKGGWHDENPPRSAGRRGTNHLATNTKLTKKEMRRKRSEILALRSKATKPLEKQITGIENEIETHEVELAQLNHSMQQASQDRDGRRIAELAQAIHARQSAIDQLFEELEKKTTDFDTQNAVYDRQLTQIEAELKENR